MAGGLVQAVLCIVKGKDGEVVQVSAANPIPMTGGGGGGTGGGGDASAANQVITNNRIGDLTEAAPGSDVASSGLNGRLQRIAQNITTLIGRLPASLGAKAGAASLSVVPASDVKFPVVQDVLGAGTDRSGTATTTSGAGLNVPANANRRALVGQNNGTVAIGFNEFGAAAAIGQPGTYVVPAGSSFSISTNRLVNFIAASGSVAVTMTEY